MVLSEQQLCVSPQQRSVHMVTEAIAVVAVTPFMAWVATRARPLNTAEKAGLWTLVLGTLAVDGVLLYRWWAERQQV